jgi:diaminohydroxyphosphoribosylaminopyrimidine deaminase/5-amino-6-(5-phosphoribosylamino)uracil reductase
MLTHGASRKERGGTAVETMTPSSFCEDSWRHRRALSTTDEAYMEQAILLARAGIGQTYPNPAVGCVLVRDGRVVGQGAHLKAGGPHAEIHALAEAGEAAAGSTAYVTLEPCSHHGRTPPCADALIAAGVARVVIALVDPDVRVAGRGVDRLRSAGIDVLVGVLAAASERLNEPYLFFKRTGLPHVLWKSAVTLDGRLAADSGQSQWVTGSAARAEVQALRRQVAAIVTGVGTLLADNPELTIRGPDHVPEASERQPVRVVLDTHLRTPAMAKLLGAPGRTVIFASPAAVAAKKEQVLELEKAGHVEVRPVQTAASGLDLDAVLCQLAGMNLWSVLLETGPTLASSFLQLGRVQRVALFYAPKLLLSGLPMLQGAPVTQHMDEALQLTDVEWRRVGDDFLVEGRVLERGE